MISAPKSPSGTAARRLDPTRANTPHSRSALVLRLLVLAALCVAQTGCATSDADLDYTRQTAPDPTQDHSYHGWNNADF